ncbi:TRAP transporter small permease [Gynuella sp.]|uniref:TRAP transporter small permease n=1 Tax=Gynuella sp. TaxID=2969146 RepID=UPI003D134C80
MKTLIASVRMHLGTVYAIGTALCLALLFAVILINAVWRYAAGGSLVWGEEAAIYLMIYGVMIGCAKAYLEDRHVRFSIGIDALPDRFRLIGLLLVDLLVTVIGAGLSWSGYAFMVKRGSIDSPGMGMPMAVFQSAMVLGGVLLTLSAVVQLIYRLTHGNDVPPSSTESLPDQGVAS